MAKLSELLALRDKEGNAPVLGYIRAALKQTGPSMLPPTELQLFAEYLAFDEAASNRSFKFAVRKFPETTQKLIALCRSDSDLNNAADLLASLADGKPKPIGAAKQAYSPDTMRSSLPKTMSDEDLGRMQKVMAVFAKALTQTPTAEVETELTFAMEGVEDLLLDTLAAIAENVEVQLPRSLAQKQMRAEEIAKALRNADAKTMFLAFFDDPSPVVLATPEDIYDEETQIAVERMVAVSVTHRKLNGKNDRAALDRLRIDIARDLLAIYRECEGAALFCAEKNDLDSAGFIFLPSHEWPAARAEMLSWLEQVEFQFEPDAQPSWARTAIPFGKIPGDASYWVMPTEGPFAGAVLLSNEDIPSDEVRYTSFVEFIATLRLFPERILCSGGYVRYESGDVDSPLFPCGYRTGHEGK
jgi:hypothetical protein